MHTIDTMTNIMKLSVHIAPVGFEIDRIVVPAVKMRADKVWLIGHNNLSEDKARAFLDKIKKTLEKKNIEVKEETADRYRLFDIVKTVKEIIFEEKDNDVYLNVASGSKIHAVGMMMATMIFDDRSNLHPFYAQQKSITIQKYLNRTQRELRQFMIYLHTEFKHLRKNIFKH